MKLKRFIKNFSVVFLICSVNLPFSLNKNLFSIHSLEAQKDQLNNKIDNTLEDNYILGPGDQLRLNIFDFPEYSES